MGEEVDECSGNDDSSSELLEDDEGNIVVSNDVESGRQNGSEYANAARGEDDGEEANTQRDVVISIWGVTFWFFFRCVTPYAVSMVY